MPIEVVVGLVGIFGVVVGGLIQFIAGSRVEKWKHTTQIRTDAYKLLLKAFSGIAAAQRGNNKADERAYQMMLTEAKAQIALYGSREVASSTARFFRDFGALDSDAAGQAFVDIAVAMRRDSYAKLYDGFRQDYHSLMLSGK